MADGTHIDATMLDSIVALFKSHKDRLTQNVLADVTKTRILLRYGWLGRLSP